MANMEELVEKQKTIAKDIESIIKNYKKDPADRKQTAAYYERRLQQLQAAWTNFEENDERIKIECQDDRSHEYFTKNFWGQVSKAKQQYKAVFVEQLKLMDNATTTDTEEKERQAAGGSGLGTSPQTKDLPSSEESSLNSSESKRAHLWIRRQQEFGKSIKRQIDSFYSNIHISSARKIHVKETVQRLWTQFETLHYNIWESESDPVNIGYDMNEFLSIEEKVRDLILNIEDAIHQASPASPMTSSVAPAPVIHLPKVKIPKFNGNYLEWRQFHDLFNEVVHKQSLANCQKMFLLKGNVEGEAARLISHLTVSEDNYKSAWDLLNQRYNNQRVLVNAFIGKLIAQPNVATEGANAIKQLHDTTKECMLGLKNLGVSVENWDPVMMFILLKKLDQTTHNLYEQSVKNPRELQPIQSFLDFLELRFQALEAIGGKGSSKTCLSTTSGTERCLACRGDHKTTSCKQYHQQTPDNRRSLIMKAKNCVNCLRPGHYSTRCSAEGCKICKKRHHTSLHEAYESKKEIRPTRDQRNYCNANTSNSEKPSTSQAAAAHTINQSAATLTASLPKEHKRSYGLLGTAIINIKNAQGRLFEFRALLDSGSQVNILTERAARRLGLKQVSSALNINGIGLTNKATKRRVYASVSSKFDDFEFAMEAYIMPKIVTHQPSARFEINDWLIPDNVTLADPHFNQPGPVDVLLGVELYYDIVQQKQISLGDDRPILQKTAFGWIVAGRIGEATASLSSTCGVLTNETEFDLQKFWELEDVQGGELHETCEGQQCEEHFNRTTERNFEGRFVVKLPFTNNTDSLGYTQELARKRFLSVERRLSLNPDLKVAYTEFMQEYIRLGHMAEIDPEKVMSPCYFLPHHGVVRPESSTTKLRVVFDASAKSSTNISLNDILAKGPTIQDDLFTILTRFRLYKYVFTADIEKMYRQILVHDDDQRYQLIFWRKTYADPLKIYQLKTVTYGTTSAPYLATKCLQRLAELEESNHPSAAAILKRDFYVDDVMSGFNTITEALHAQGDLIKLLKKGGFKLRKWCGNHPRLIEGLYPSDVAVNLDFNTKDESGIKTLGQVWIPTSDEFQIKINKTSHEKCTKRTVSSDISRIFDPLGLLGPVTVEAKLFLQHLWTLKLDWDQELSNELKIKWQRYMDHLSNLNDIKVSRNVFGNEIPTSTQLHVFADASERAYGGVIYIRSTTAQGRVIVRLLCAKSRLAPIKKLTIPRLELCAALLAAQLLNRVNKSMQLPNVTTFLWTDSEIVLSWINATSTSYYAFVANRIAKIQQITTKAQWRHVRSKDNPADVLSRGIAANKLSTCNIWFYGPMFLHGHESEWPAPYVAKNQCQVELKGAVNILLSATARQHFVFTINHKNSFSRLERITAYIIRCKQYFLKAPAEGNGAILSNAEIEQARRIIFRAIQEEELPQDYAALSKGQEVCNSSSLQSLSPFVDKDGQIRVGGRLQSSSLPYNTKHPVLLPDCEFTRILMNEIHVKNKHIGAQGLIAIMRQRYWPLKAKILARLIVHKCVRCTRAKPTLMKQIMGNLPEERVEPARAFINSGVDFWGPIWTHYRIRGKRPTKSYVAVFCCFATKAIHMEVVTDLTTDAFIMALKRFIGRRGMCKRIHCDNATNFVGAKNELEELKNSIFGETSQNKIKGACCIYNIDFAFIPARAPHFGGLWEAAVKSAKFLFKRSTASASLTYEELETLIIEIEAILNSRPLTPSSNDANDLAAITPGHILVGEPLTATVDVEAKPLQLSMKKRWERVVHLKEEFWNRWRSEYLSELQQRSKWRQNQENIKIGQLVLVHEENTPSLQWPLARIIETFTGPDGKVRVANVRTKNGILKRAIHRLAPLPIEPDEGAEKAEIPVPTNSSLTQQSDVTPIQQQTQQGDFIKGPTPKRRRLNMGAVLVTTLLACLLAPTSGTPILETFEKPGIYFESIGTACILSSQWNIMVYYNLTSFWNSWKSIRSATEAMDHICSRSENHFSCNRIVELYRLWHDDLESENTLISKPSRTKRGALDIVGNIQHTLFGVLDSNYEQEMSKTLNEFSNNESQLKALFQNHTSVLDATLNIMKQAQETSQQRFNQLDALIQQILFSEHNVSNFIQIDSIFQSFTSLAIEVLTLTQNFQNQQQAILDAVMDGRHGKLNPLLISTDQLKAELQNIRTHLHQDFQLPIPEDDIIEYYKLIKIHSLTTKTQIIFSLILPITNSDTFELFQLSSIPMSTNSSLFIINPVSGYIGINLQKDQLYPFGNNLAACHEASYKRHLCQQQQPIYLANAEFGKCEMDLFHNRKSQNCRLHKIDKDMMWSQLHNSNQWIYGVSHPISINLICNNTLQHITLNNSGRLEVQGHCVLKHEQIIIHGHHIYTSQSRKAYARFTPVPLLNSTFELPKISYNPSKYAVSLDEINNLRETLKQSSTEGLNMHHVHHYVTNYTTLAIMITITIAVAIWYYRRRREVKKPVPLPRSRSNFVVNIEDEI